MEQLIQKIIKQKIPCYFISPHFDDAVLSSGNLLLSLRGKVPVTVATVFTQGGENPLTYSAKSFLRQCGYKTPDALYKARTIEDITVFNQLQIPVMHLGFKDALWRKKKTLPFFEFLGKYVAEFIYTYPTYILHLVSGKIAKEDTPVILRLQKVLQQIVKKEKKYLVFCPLAIGTHIDHLVTRNACASVFKKNIIYWSDFPYNLKSKEDTDFMNVHHLSKVFLPASTAKNEFINGYVSQVGPLFSNKVITKIPEFYYVDTDTMLL